MSETASQKHFNPWYREPWAWLVAAPLILVFISCSIMVTIAVRSADDRVSDNYYKEGRMLAQEFTSDEFARSIGVVADVKFNSLRNLIVAEISADQADILENVLELSLLISHPAEQEKDIQLVLTPSTKHSFRAELPQNLQGRWYLRLQGLGLDSKELWRLHGEIQFDQQQAITLAPK